MGGWLAGRPPVIYNIQRGSRRGRSTGQAEVVERWKRRVAIPRAVSCSHVQPRASFYRAFLPTSACPVILTSGAAGRVAGAAREKEKCGRFRGADLRVAGPADARRESGRSRKRVRARPARRRGCRERASGLGKSLDVLSEVFDIPKMICAVTAVGGEARRERKERRKRETERTGEGYRVLAGRGRR